MAFFSVCCRALAPTTFSLKPSSKSQTRLNSHGSSSLDHLTVTSVNTGSADTSPQFMPNWEETEHNTDLTYEFAYQTANNLMVNPAPSGRPAARSNSTLSSRSVASRSIAPISIAPVRSRARTIATHNVEILPGRNVHLVTTRPRASTECDIYEGIHNDGELIFNDEDKPEPGTWQKKASLGKSRSPSLVSDAGLGGWQSEDGDSVGQDTNYSELNCFSSNVNWPVTEPLVAENYGIYGDVDDDLLVTWTPAEQQHSGMLSPRYTDVPRDPGRLAASQDAHCASRISQLNPGGGQAGLDRAQYSVINRARKAEKKDKTQQ